MDSLAKLRRPDFMPARVDCDPDALKHANRIAAQIGDIRGDTAEQVRTVLSTVLADDLIRRNAKGADIRRMAMAGDVTVALLRKFGLDAGAIVPLTIGDIDLPESLPGSNYSPLRAMQEIMQEAHRCYDYLAAKYGFGYDTAAKGYPEARRAMIAFFDAHYGFSQAGIDMDALAEQTCITSGGLAALKHIATSRIDDIAERRVKEPGNEKLRHRAIQPDASFATWLSMINRSSLFGEGGEVHKIKMLQEDLLQPTAKQVNLFYKTHPVKTETADYEDTWCIAPVGNPSGTVIEPQQLTDVCEAIISNNPHALIILDCAYVRRLKPEMAKKLLYGVINIPQILNRVVFVESFSKTHGVCGVRAGGFFSTNPEIFAQVCRENMLNTAGNGLDKSAFVWAASCATPEQNAALSAHHDFHRDERLGLWHYLKKPQFADLFDADQSHISPEQLAHPGGLYLTPKLASGSSQEKVALRTRCLGVKAQLDTGSYIRLSIGEVRSTFAKYIPR
ncbi:aminotransferase class I/II-fold pyridoxal phosphate-dependent enzyme [Candidatus Peregrinibacteria bacterium]|nr:aminotransferase class I/II-fold pyridoxal phosphate-dependent enzyme [Candidatus Peregrinibacteria bacterium]